MVSLFRFRTKTTKEKVFVVACERHASALRRWQVEEFPIDEEGGMVCDRCPKVDEWDEPTLVEVPLVR